MSDRMVGDQPSSVVRGERKPPLSGLDQLDLDAGIVFDLPAVPAFVSTLDATHSSLIKPPVIRANMHEFE